MGDSEEISQATILIFAHHLGIDIDAEEQLMFIAKEALQNMPEGWELGVSPEGDENAGIPYFFKIESGESVWEHPNDEMYKERVKEERIKRAAAAAERKKAKLLKEGSPKGVSGRKGSLVAERAGAFEKGTVKGDGTAEMSPLDTTATTATATAASTTNPATSTNVKVPLASAMAFINSAGKTNKNISPVKQAQLSTKSDETIIPATIAKIVETIAVAATTSANTTSTTSIAPSVVVSPATTSSSHPIVSSTTTASATSTITATTTATTATAGMVSVTQSALVAQPVAGTAATQGLGKGLGKGVEKGQGLEPSSMSTASTHIHPSATATATATTTASYTQPTTTQTQTPSSSSMSVQSLAATASTTPQYGLLSVVIDGAKLHSKFKPGEPLIDIIPYPPTFSSD